MKVKEDKGISKDGMQRVFRLKKGNGMLKTIQKDVRISRIDNILRNITEWERM